MWLVIVLTVATILTLYLGLRLINPTHMSRKRKLAAWALVALLLFGQRLTWFLRRDGAEGLLYNAIDWIGFVFLGFVSILVIFMLFRDFPMRLGAQQIGRAHV